MSLADIKRGRLTGEEVAEIERLAERRLKASQIALRLNRHPATVNFAMHRLGLKETVRRVRPTTYTRNGVVVRTFTDEEDAYIVALRVQQLTTTKIADLVGKRFGHPRTPATINMRLTMPANSEAA